MSILKQLFNGEIYPAENNVPDTEEYQKASQEMHTLGDKLEEELTGKQEEIFEQYMSASAGVDTLIQQEVFRQGFVMGAAIQKEIES